MHKYFRKLRATSFIVFDRIICSDFGIFLFLCSIRFARYLILCYIIWWSGSYQIQYQQKLCAYELSFFGTWVLHFARTMCINWCACEIAVIFNRCKKYVIFNITNRYHMATYLSSSDFLIIFERKTKLSKTNRNILDPSNMLSYYIQHSRSVLYLFVCFSKAVHRTSTLLIEQAYSDETDENNFIIPQIKLICAISN